jgi:hypothetical protein
MRNSHSLGKFKLFSAFMQVVTALGWYGGRTATSLMVAGMAGTNIFQCFVGWLLLDGY